MYVPVDYPWILPEISSYQNERYSPSETDTIHSQQSSQTDLARDLVAMDDGTRKLQALMYDIHVFLWLASFSDSADRIVSRRPAYTQRHTAR